MTNPLGRRLVSIVSLFCLCSMSIAEAEESTYRSPLQISLSPDGRYAYVVNHTADSIAVLDVVARKVIDEIPVGSRPAHAAVSPDGQSLYVTSLYGGRVEVLDLEDRRITRTFSTGHEPYGITISPDGERLYVANAVSNSVSIIDVRTGETISETNSGSNPRFVARTPDGSRLAVSNGLLRNVTIIDAATGRVEETRDLGKAAVLREIAITPDGKWAFVVHLVSHEVLIPSQLERGRIHSNGFSVLALDRPGHRVTLLLDQLLVGAANPWGLALSADSRRLYVSLAGVHEVAVVDVEKALQRKWRVWEKMSRFWKSGRSRAAWTRADSDPGGWPSAGRPGSSWWPIISATLFPCWTLSGAQSGQ
jgi:YVTN family beta-propeller protein